MIVDEEVSAISEYVFIEIEDYVAIYERTSLPDSFSKTWMGNVMPSTAYRLDNDQMLHIEGSWHYLSGVQNKKYLVCSHKNGDNTLWRFNSFATDQKNLGAFYTDKQFERQYPYSDVLTLIYNVTSENDIEEITITPDDYDRTPKGKELQSQIKILNIQDDTTIQKIYSILSSMECYGSGANEIMSSLKTRELAEQLGIQAWTTDEGWLRRSVEIKTVEGTIINSLKYSAIWGCFWEYDTIVYKPLTDNAMKEIDDLFLIEETIQKKEVP